MSDCHSLLVYGRCDGATSHADSPKSVYSMFNVFMHLFRCMFGLFLVTLSKCGKLSLASCEVRKELILAVSQVLLQVKSSFSLRGACGPAPRPKEGAFGPGEGGCYTIPLALGSPPWLLCYIN